MGLLGAIRLQPALMESGIVGYFGAKWSTAGADDEQESDGHDQSTSSKLLFCHRLPPIASQFDSLFVVASPGRRPCTQTNLGLNAYFIIELIAERLLSGGGGLKGLGFWDS